MPFRVARFALLLISTAGAGCSFYNRPPAETPAAPTFDDAAAAQEGQAARAAPDFARWTGDRFRRYGLQPLTREDRQYAIGQDTIAAGWIAGKDAVVAGKLIVVAVSPASGPQAIGGFLEGARVLGRLSRHYLIPEPTLLFATLPRGREEAVLAALRRPATWVADSVQAVIVVGGSPEAGRLALPAQATAGATARELYGLIRRIGYDRRSRPDTVAVGTLR